MQELKFVKNSKTVNKAWDTLKDRNKLFDQIIPDVQKTIQQINTALGISFKMPDNYRLIDPTGRYSLFSEQNTPNTSRFVEHTIATSEEVIEINHSLPYPNRYGSVEMSTNLNKPETEQDQIFTLFHEITHSLLLEHFHRKYNDEFNRLNKEKILENNPNLSEEKYLSILNDFKEFWIEGFTEFISRVYYLCYCKMSGAKPTGFLSYPRQLDFVASLLNQVTHVSEQKDKSKFSNKEDKFSKLNDLYLLSSFKKLINYVAGKDFDHIEKLINPFLYDEQMYEHIKFCSDLSRREEGDFKEILFDRGYDIWPGLVPYKLADSILTKL